MKDLAVPEGIFKSTRVAKTRGKTDENRPAESSKSVNTSTAGISRYSSFPAPTIPNQPESSGQVLMYQPYPNHDASAGRQQNDIDAPPVQQYPAHASNPLPVQTSGPREPNQYHSQPYRPLFPSSHPRPAPDRLHQDPSEYNPGSQPISVKFNTTDIQQPSIPLPRFRPENERVPSSSHQNPPVHLSADNSSTSDTHGGVVDAYTPNSQSFPAVTPSGWAPSEGGTLGPTNSSIYYSDRTSVIPGASAQQQAGSYPQPHNETTADSAAQSYEPLQYLNPPHGELAGGNTVSREPLPPLSLLQDTYTFSYEASVSMVASGVALTSTSTSGSFGDGPSHGPSGSSVPPKTRTSRAGGPCRDLDLAPLNSLARLHPYRREPMDDRALRLLGLKST